MNQAPTAEEYLAQASLWRLLAVLGLVTAPHLQRLPVWAAVAVVALIFWRGAVAWRQWRLPNRWLRTALAVGAFIGIYASFGSVSGQTAGVALLVLMAALKLTELRARRDVMLLVFLCYFILVTHFLFSQELWTVAYLLVCVSAITAVLIEINHAGEALAPKISLRLSGRMVLQALPLMALIFVLFPRVPGPLWGLPADAGASRSGLSDSMSPGDIASLIESNEVAFRVSFDDAAPAMRERYWRGPVFDYFDGRRWATSGRGERLPPALLQPQGPAIRYEVTLEANRQPWLLALDMPSAEAMPDKARLHGFGNLLTLAPVLDRVRYKVVSYTRYRLEESLSETGRSVALQLPARRSPRTRQLAGRWRQEGMDDQAIVERALRMFREESYYYTLKPPRLAGDAVDEFLFESRRGFCEHYASSFTVLMRAAGIPARVVTGYQGGERNDLGGHYVVSQSDAHAWSEVWLAGRGWVRIDPTAAVAPQRIERGLSTALGQSGELPAFLRRDGMRWRMELEVRWEWINSTWNAVVLAYGPELQQRFLRRFGLDELRDMILALTGVITLFLTGVGLMLMRRAQPLVRADAALRLWRKAQRKLSRDGLVQRPDEGPEDFTRRVIQERPDLAQRMQSLLQSYLRLRYLHDPSPAAEKILERAVKALPV